MMVPPENKTFVRFHDCGKAARQGRLFLLRLLQSFDLLGVELEEFVVEIKLLLNFVHQVRIGEGL